MYTLTRRRCSLAAGAGASAAGGSLPAFCGTRPRATAYISCTNPLGLQSADAADVACRMKIAVTVSQDGVDGDRGGEGEVMGLQATFNGRDGAPW